MLITIAAHLNWLANIITRIISITSDHLPDKEKQFKENEFINERSRGFPFVNGQAWYLAHCKPNSEQIALRNLQNQGFAAFLPLQKLTQRKGSSFQTLLRPLFQSYIFVAQDPTAGQWRKINNTRGISRLVRFADEPTAVPEKIMGQLFALCDTNGVFQPSVSLTTGNNVEITQGPFAGAIAKIIEIDPNQRVYLLFDFMGQTSKMTVDVAAVVPTAEHQ